MTGILAQLITLTAYGNEYLRNGKIPENFTKNNSSFKFCKKINFMEFRENDLSGKYEKRIIAENPVEWFEYLKLNQCRFLRLYYQSSNKSSQDYRLAGFVGGGGTWLIEAVYKNYSHYFASNWEVTDKNDPDNNIWTVKYGANAMEQRISDIQLDNQDVKEKLNKILNEIEIFAEKNQFHNFAEIFSKSKDILQSDTPEKDYYYYDLIPIKNYSLLSRQILFSAAGSWVFGGMGSWNDVGFEEKSDYEVHDRLSEQLYSTIISAILAAVNSF